MHAKTSLGRHGEHIVSTFLIKQGFTILAANYTRKNGEVDLIASKDDVMAFVEVKTRSKIFVDAAEVVPHAKQRKIIAVAQEYIARHGHDNKICRFDVALIDAYDNGIVYLEDAFRENE